MYLITKAISILYPTVKHIAYIFNLYILSTQYEIIMKLGHTAIIEDNTEKITPNATQIIETLSRNFLGFSVSINK